MGIGVQEGIHNVQVVSAQAIGNLPTCCGSGDSMERKYVRKQNLANRKTLRNYGISDISSESILQSASG